MMRSHIQSWRMQKHDTSIEEADRKYYHRRYRRRMQVSGTFIAIGLLLPFGDLVLPHIVPNFVQPQAMTAFWATILLLVFWVVLRALGDAVSTRAHLRVALARVRQRQRELEQQAAELRRRGSNGHPTSEKH